MPLRAATLPYRKPELGKHYWIKDNILPDAFPVVERCLNKTEWTMGAPWCPEPWPGMRAPDDLLPEELPTVLRKPGAKPRLRAGVRPDDVGGRHRGAVRIQPNARVQVRHRALGHRVLRLGPRTGLEADRGGLLLEDRVVMIDLRSDTVTKPSPAMREAMAH